MTKYYARHSSGQNFGCFLDVWNLEVTSDRLNVGVSGGYHSYAGSWFFTTYASLSYYESSGHDWENGDYYAHDSADITFFSASDFFLRHEGYNRSINLYCYMETTVNGQYGTANANVWVTVPALPPSATTLTLESYTDNQATLSWTNPGGIKQAICIERRSNGGAWGEVQVIWGGATATSWTDTSLAVNNTYEYRFRYFNEKAYGAYSNVVSVVTSPSAPTAISVVSAGGTNVNVTLTNDSSVSTGIVWQWSPDKDDESSWSGSTAVSGSPVTSFVASGVVGKAYIRVANTANGVQSGWIVSEQVITIAPPNPPVAKTPAGDVVSTDAESILFSWDLNIIDKTDPTAYEFRYKVGEGSWVTTNKVLSSTANSHTLQMSTFSAGNVVTWQARVWAAATTGGSDNQGASDWSTPDAFAIHTPPQIEITSPNHVVDGVNTVSDMPILVTARITDVEGFSVDYAEMVLRDSAGVVYPQDGVPDMAGVHDGIVEFEIASSDFLPDNHSEYTVVVSATSGTTLSNTARTSFTTSFTEPVEGTLQMQNDPDTGYASLLATFDNSASEVEYSGETNEQYESTEGYVRSLTVEGKGEIIKSRNLLHQTYVGQPDTATSNGMWASFNADGSVSLHGQNTASSSKALRFEQIKTASGIAEPLVEGDYYYSAVNGGQPITGVDFGLQKGGYSTYSIMNAGNSYGMYHVNAEEAAGGLFFQSTFVYVASGVSIEGITFYPMLTKTLDELTPYEPYFEPYIKSIEGVSIGDGTITTPLRGLPQGKGDELQVNGTSASKLDRTYYDTISAVGTVNTSGSTWYAGLTTTNQATLRRNWTSADDFNSDRGTTGTEFAYCTKTTKISATGKGIFIARTWNALYAYCTAADAQELGITTSDFAALVGAGVIARNKTVTDSLPDISLIEIGSAFTVGTDLDSTFSMTTWDGSADAVSISVSRVNADGTITPLLTDGVNGSGIVDKYAPLNTPYQYAVTTVSEEDSIKTVYVTNIISSSRAFFYFDDDMASARWNQSYNVSYGRPEQEELRFSGRTLPVLVDDRAQSIQGSANFTILDRSETAAFKRLMAHSGSVVYKSTDGDVMHAKVSVGFSRTIDTVSFYMQQLSINYTQVDGVVL